MLHWGICKLRRSSLHSGGQSSPVLSCPMSSLPVETTHVSAVVQGDVWQKISVPPRTYPQFRRTTEHVARTFLVSQSSRTCPHGCAALDPSSLRFAPSLFRLTGRGCAAQLAQLPRACCKLESRITTCAGRQRGCAAQAALARSSVAEDGALRYSYGPAASRGCRSSRRGTRARELCYPSS